MADNTILFILYGILGVLLVAFVGIAIYRWRSGRPKGEIDNMFSGKPSNFPQMRTMAMAASRRFTIPSMVRSFSLSANPETLVLGLEIPKNRYNDLAMDQIVEISGEATFIEQAPISSVVFPQRERPDISSDPLEGNASTPEKIAAALDEIVSGMEKTIKSLPEPRPKLHPELTPPAPPSQRYSEPAPEQKAKPERKPTGKQITTECSECGKPIRTLDNGKTHKCRDCQYKEKEEKHE